MNANIFKMQLSIAGLLLLVSIIPASSQTWTRYQSRPGSKVKLEGTSTLHDWAVEGKIIGGFMELDSGFPLDPSAKSPPSAKLNAKVEVKIPVTSLLSEKQLMDDVMYEALKEKQHRDILYRLKQISPKANAAAGPSQFDAVGELSIAGVSRTNSMAVTIERLDASRLKVKGATSIKMSDYGVKVQAPLGLPLKTGDDVKITFEWVAAKKTEPAK